MSVIVVALNRSGLIDRVGNGIIIDPIEPVASVATYKNPGRHP